MKAQATEGTQNVSLSPMRESTEVFLWPSSPPGHLTLSTRQVAKEKPLGFEADSTKVLRVPGSLAEAYMSEAPGRTGA